MDIKKVLLQLPAHSKKLRFILIHTCLAIIVASLVTGCAKKEADASSSETPAPADSPTSVTSTIDSTGITSGVAEGSVQTGANTEDLIENSNFSNLVSIDFGSSLNITNPLSVNGITITQQGSAVTITSTAANVEYKLSGTTANGSVKIQSDNKFKLSLNGVSITNADGPAIQIQSSQRAFIVLADNTINNLTDGANYTSSNLAIGGTLYSDGQLIFSGNGTLNVQGNYKDAVYSNDDIRIRSGNINITGAVKDGIHTNNAFISDGGTVDIKAGSDGIQSENGYIIINKGVFTLNTVNEGIAASYAGIDKTINPYVTINGGTVTVKSSAGEGIQTKSALTVNKGTISILSKEDGFNAGTAIYINGGNIYSYSTANDGMDSNGILTITGGRVIAVGSMPPEAGFDCDARTFKITGGMVLGIGGATSSPSTTVSKIRSVVLGSVKTKSIFHIESEDGAEVLTFFIPAYYSTMLFASPKLKANATYNLYSGGSIASGTNLFGLYTSGVYTKGIKYATFTSSSMLIQIGGTINKV